MILADVVDWADDLRRKYGIFWPVSDTDEPEDSVDEFETFPHGRTLTE